MWMRRREVKENTKKGFELTKWHPIPELDVLECKVKWALGSPAASKASGGDGIPAELFKILNDAIKVLQPTRQQIWKTQQ